jgi:hypothetical protein
MSSGWTPPPYPSQPPQPPQRPPGGLPTWAQILIGAVAGPFVLGAAAVPAGALASFVGDSGASGVGGLISLAGLGVPFVVWLGAVVWRPTRWYAVGALIGFALLVIVLAGVCIALITAMSSTG